MFFVLTPNMHKILIPVLLTAVVVTAGSKLGVIFHSLTTCRAVHGNVLGQK